MSLSKPRLRKRFRALRTALALQLLPQAAHPARGPRVSEYAEGGANAGHHFDKKEDQERDARWLQASCGPEDLWL